MTKEEKLQERITFNALYQEEIENFYSLSEEKQKEILKATEEQIYCLEPNELELAQRMGTLMLAIVYCGDLLEEPITEENVNKLYQDRIQWIEEAERFFSKPESEEIYQKYGILQTDSSGRYKIDELLETIFEDEGFQIEHYEKDHFKKMLAKVWNNRRQFPTEEILKEESIKQNGISFKEHLFCEEYIRTGKITKTSESLGISRQTCYDYLKKEEVKKYLDERRREIKEESDNLLKTGFFDCFQELHKLATKEKCIDDSNRIKAIDTYLKHYENSIYKSTEIQE